MSLPGLSDLAALVKSWDQSEFWFWTIAALVFAVISFFRAFKGLHNSRLLEDTPTSLVRSASQGYVELQGKGFRLDGEPVLAPLTRTACTWWSFKIEVHESYRVGRTRTSHWRVINKGTSEALFGLRDTTGTCVIDPDGAEVLPSETSSWRGRTPWPEGRKSSLFGSYRYTENRLHDGDPMTAIGYLTTHRGSDAGNFDEDVRALLGEWKRDRDEMLRKFDTDGDGSVSLKEWESARKLAEEQIRSERSKEIRTPGIPVLARPPDGRSFLIAGRTPDQLARYYGRQGLVSIVLFFLLLTIGVAMISLRLS